MSHSPQVERRPSVAPDAHRAVQLLLYAASVVLVVATSLYAYA